MFPETDFGDQMQGIRRDRQPVQILLYRPLWCTPFSSTHSRPKIQLRCRTHVLLAPTRRSIPPVPPILRRRIGTGWRSVQAIWRQTSVPSGID